MKTLIVILGIFALLFLLSAESIGEFLSGLQRASTHISNR